MVYEKVGQELHIEHIEINEIKCLLLCFAWKSVVTQAQCTFFYRLLSHDGILTAALCNLRRYFGPQLS